MSRSLSAAVALATALVGACAIAGSPDGAGPEAIRTARAALGGTISEVGAAVVATREDVTAVRLGDPPDPSARLEAVTAARERDLTALDDALRTATAGDLEATDPAVAQALEAWEVARGAARDLRREAEEDLDHTAVLAEVDASLAEIVSAWEEPGSRSQQVERFTVLRDRARSLASELEGQQERPACAAGIGRRLEAARWVASATEELLTAVQQRRGGEFDARRRELSADPYGLDGGPADASTRLADLDGGDRGCWLRDGATPAAVDRFDAAVERIEAALNPGSG